MSHFAVAVFHKKDQNIEDLLAPYNENLEVEPYVRYTHDGAITLAREVYKTDGMTDDECWEMIAEEHDNNVDAEGNIYTTYNPNSKWDWYVVGGRFSNMLNADGALCDSAKVGNVDFSPDMAEYKRSLDFWDTVVKHKKSDDEQKNKYFTLYNEQYYLDYYGDRETYARRCSQFLTYAVVTPDGVWHEKGQMGWFGLSSETPEKAGDWADNYKKRFIDAADPDWYITIVDCHI